MGSCCNVASVAFLQYSAFAFQTPQRLVCSSYADKEKPSQTDLGKTTLPKFVLATQPTEFGRHHSTSQINEKTEILTYDWRRDKKLMFYC